jgi:hypothetical protein
VLAVILLATLTLPIILLEIVRFVTEAVEMPVNPCETLVEDPLTSIEAMVLLEMETVPVVVSTKIPELIPFVVLVVAITELVPLTAPIVFPTTVPMFALPADIYIPHHGPPTVKAPEEEEKLKLVIIFP